MRFFKSSTWKWITVIGVILLAILDVIVIAASDDNWIKAAVIWINCVFTVVAWLIAAFIILSTWDFEIGMDDGSKEDIG